MVDEKAKVHIVTKKVVIMGDDHGHYGFMTCGVCGIKVEDKDKNCPACGALFSNDLDIKPHPFGGSDF